jgi:acyl carrier protein
MRGDTDAVLSAVYQAIDQLNETMPPGKHVPKDPNALLAGAGGHLDSLGLVNLIVETEQVIEERFGTYVNLGDERSASQARNPLESVSTLTDYIRACLDGSGRG